MKKSLVIDAENLADFIEDAVDLYREKFDEYEANHKFYDEITEKEIVCEKVKTQRFRLRVNEFKVVVGEEIWVRGRCPVNYYVLGYVKENEAIDAEYVESAREKKCGVFEFSVRVFAGAYDGETLEIKIW